MASSGVEMIDRRDYTPIAGSTPVSGGLFHLPPPSALAALVQRIKADVPHAAEAIDELTRVLAAPRLQVESLGGSKPIKHWRVSYTQERNTKLTMYAKEAWRESHDDAVKAEVADLVAILVAEPAHHDATLRLLHEFVAGGFGFVQSALYFAISDAPGPFLTFLSSHLVAKSPLLLSVLQQLCENHHAQWQSLMHIDGTSSCLLRACDLLAALTAEPRELNLENAHMLCDVLMFLSEACQGPCAQNQDQLLTTRAVAIAAGIVLSSRKAPEAFDDAVPTKLQITLQHHASDLLLALLEGRSDARVHKALVDVFPIQKVMTHFTSSFRAINEKLGAKRHHFFSPLKLLEMAHFSRTSPDALMRAMPEYKGAINLLRIVKNMLHLDEAIAPDTAWLEFASKWRDFQANATVKEALSYFEAQMVSVEVTRGGSTYTVYFLQPKVAKLFNDELRTRLLDAMDIGTEQALDVLVSEAATDVVDELNVMKYLSKNQFYSTMSKWAPWLRANMLRVCFYINFVMLLSVDLNDMPAVGLPTSVVPKDDAKLAPYFISMLGFVLLLMATTLWLYYAFSAFCFNYAKQQVSSLTKLTLSPGATIRQTMLDAFARPLFYFELFLALFLVVFYLKMDTGVIQSCILAALMWLVYSLLAALRVVSGQIRFVVNADASDVTSTVTSMLTFIYNVLFDTAFTDTVLLMGTYALCFLLGVGLSMPWMASLVSTGPWGLVFFGFPLVDILATNEKLRFIAQAMRSNFGKLGVTAIFGAIVIYIFSLIGFFFLQAEMTSDDDGSLCSTLLECYASYIRYGLLAGGGIGDYMSSSLGHNLDYAQPKLYFQRMVYDMAFYVIVITLFLNMIQGIIIDAFTSVREASEQKAAMKRDRCLVCNRSRNAIEVAGMEKGLLNNFGRHTETEHNLYHYFFYIQYVLGKDDKERNGIESYVYEKLKTSDMSWIPRV